MVKFSLANFLLRRRKYQTRKIGIVTTITANTTTGKITATAIIPGLALEDDSTTMICAAVKNVHIIQFQ